MKNPMPKSAVLLGIGLLLIVNVVSTAAAAIDKSHTGGVGMASIRKRLDSNKEGGQDKQGLKARDDNQDIYDLGQNCGFAPAWEVAGLPPPPDYDPYDCVVGGGGENNEPDGYDWSQADEVDYSGDEVDDESYDTTEDESYDTYDDGGDYSGDQPTVAVELPLVCLGICL